MFKRSNNRISLTHLVCFRSTIMFNLSQVFRLRMCCNKCRSLSYKSVYNVENLYPNSKPTFSSNSTHNTIHNADDETFSGNIPKSKVKFSYSKSSGPGGQHVNKRLTKVEMRFHVGSADWLPHKTRMSLLEKFGGRLTKGGELIVASEGSRYLLNNERECFEKVLAMIRQAETPPPPSRQERAAAGVDMDRVHEAHKRRLQRKRKDSFTRSMRSAVFD